MCSVGYQLSNTLSHKGERYGKAMRVPLLVIADTVRIFDFGAIVASVALYAAFVWFLKRRLKLRLLPRVKHMDKKNHPQR